jgi:glycolate oxidase FAD binding subunit
MRSETGTSLAPDQPGATAAVLIDGVEAASVVAPETPEAVAETLAEAAERGLAVAPVGGSTALSLGNPPERVDLALSTARLAGVIAYEPTDLVLSVGAGARFGDVQAVLAEHGQELPLDPPLADRATIGGLIATALAGPRRLSSGTLRDLLIGISVAHPSGTVTKAGGMVVKNVSGFDLARVYHGSLGTLGVIVSANFKVLPAPRAETTILAEAASPDEALTLAERVRGGRVQPAALEVSMGDDGWWVAVRLLGRTETVAALATEVEGSIRQDTARLVGEESRGWWREYVDALAVAHAPREVLVRCAARPKASHQLVRDALAATCDRGLRVRRLAASVGLGTVMVRATNDDEDGDRLKAWRDDLLRSADHVTVLAAPPDWKRGIDVWGPEPAGLDIMRALKEQFDPHRVLNPGRFAGGI